MFIDQETAARIAVATEARRAERRRFLRFAGGASVVAGTLPFLVSCGGSGNGNGATATPTPTPTPTSTSGTVQAELDVLNFALNLEYLEAQFYLYATTGAGLTADLTSGTSGTLGTVTGGRQVGFTDAAVAAYAREIAADERQHVAFLRTALGTAAVAMPAINIDGTQTTGAFAQAARAAGIAAADGTFDPYASDENFLLAAFIFEDVGVTAYKGATSTLIYTAGYQEAASGLLSAEAYHAGLIRATLYQKGIATPSLRTNADKISDARDALDGMTATPTPTPSPSPTATTNVDQKAFDQGISGTATQSNIAPTDAYGLVFSRTAPQVLNIAYLTKTQATSGGFFPAGVNGNVKTSANNA